MGNCLLPSRCFAFCRKRKEGYPGAMSSKIAATTETIFFQLSKKAAAREITNKGKANKQENKTKSLRAIRICIPEDEHKMSCGFSSAQLRCKYSPGCPSLSRFPIRCVPDAIGVVMLSIFCAGAILARH